MASERLKPALKDAGKFLLVLTTVGNAQQARRLAQKLVQKKVAACVNLLPRINSWYWWRGKVNTSPEVLLFIKTSKARLAELSRLLHTHHPYELPEFIALSLAKGSRSYLSWLSGSL